MEKLQELFTDRVNNTLWATKKHFYDKFEVEQNLNRLDMLKQFIKWLVDNDKIDRDKIIENSDFMPIFSDELWDFLQQPTEEQELLMLLSIQESPIEFLISILK